jgi:hypothetical protein
MNLLGSFQPTAAVTKEVIGTDSNITGKSQVSLACIAAGLADGTSAKVYVQVRVGASWYDVASFAFTTGSGAKMLSVSTAGLSAAATLTDGSLTDNTAIQGLLGKELRAILTTTGTYTAGTVSVYYQTHD